jgi:hypothetical protein
MALKVSFDVHKLTTAPVAFWWGLSLVLPIYFGAVSLYRAVSHNYAVQDDVRQHVVWMQRYVDPELFPNDWIADYFQTIAPAGYKALYYVAAQLGIEPLLFAKILPLILGTIATAYCFGVSLQLLPVPAGAWITSVILIQSLWLEDDIVTATPRAFLYPIFLAFLYYLLKRSIVPCLLAIALQVLFYPQLALVEVGILTLRLLHQHQGRWQLSAARSDWLLWGAGCGFTIALLLLFQADLGAFGPPVSEAQMRSMPEFAPKGRTQFFHPNPLQFWLTGNSGISLSSDPPLIWASFLLPVLLQYRLPLASAITAKIRLLPEILLSSLGLFMLAHLLLPRLYVPSRYTQHSLRVLMVLAAGIALTLILDRVRRWLRSLRPRGQAGTIACLCLLAAAALVVPAIPAVFISENAQLIGGAPRLYQFFAGQPKDVLIASLSEEVNSLPTYSQRSILVGREYVLPYHIGYYTQMRQRAIDLLTAQYSPDLAEVQQFVRQYGVDFWLIDRDAFDPEYIEDSDWLMQFAATAEAAIDRLAQAPPVLQQKLKQCTALRLKRFVVLKADCVAGAP